MSQDLDAFVEIDFRCRSCCLSLKILLTLLHRHVQHVYNPKYALIATKNSSHHVAFLLVTCQCGGHLTCIGLLWNPCWFLFSIQTSRGCVLSSLSSPIFLVCFLALIQQLRLRLSRSFCSSSRISIKLCLWCDIKIQQPSAQSGSCVSSAHTRPSCVVVVRSSLLPPFACSSAATLSPQSSLLRIPATSDQPSLGGTCLSATRSLGVCLHKSFPYRLPHRRVLRTEGGLFHPRAQHLFNTCLDTHVVQPHHKFAVGCHEDCCTCLKLLSLVCQNSLCAQGGMRFRPSKPQVVCRFSISVCCFFGFSCSSGPKLTCSRSVSPFFFSQLLSQVFQCDFGTNFIFFPVCLSK